MKYSKLIIIILVLVPYNVFASSAPSSGEVIANPNPKDILALVLYVLLALLFSFLCSVAEAVLLNITPSYTADLQEKDPDFAAKVKKIRLDNIDQSLAAILTTNTIAHTVGAIGSGAKATIVFGSALFGVFSAIMTLFILFLSEIIPKTVGVVYWRKLVKFVMAYIKLITIILYPIIWISEFITRIITKGKSVHVFNKDEFVAMASVGIESGAFKEHESSIITNLFKLETLTAKNIFTPRTVIMGFDQNLTVSDVFAKKPKIPFSRLLIFDGNMDNTVGFILKDDLLLLKAQNKGETKLVELKRDIILVPVDIKLSKLLEIFLQKRQHIALVVDDYGTKGIVTNEDVLETLLGIEIIDEDDDVEDMQVLAKEIWKKRMKRLGYDSEILSDESAEFD